MALIVTYLGKGGTGRTTAAIAAAKQFAASGQRVLLASQDPGPAFALLLEADCGPTPTTIAPNLDAVQLQAAALLEESWEEVKRQEARYLRSPFLKSVYGQELSVLPGMDLALALNTLREQDASGKYDVIVYDGPGDQTTLRMLGMPEILSWYLRRFRSVFLESDVVKALTPFLQPMAGAVLNVDWSGGNALDQPTQQVNGMLDEGRMAVADASRVVAYLVTTGEPAAIATATYLWGSAQQIGLTVGGVIFNAGAASAEGSSSEVKAQFAPLPVVELPARQGDWQPLMAALPDVAKAASAPRSATVDLAARQVKLFLPGFTKQQVKLTQYGPEVTIEAGDQRRNVALPPELRGKAVTGAKFADGYLTISFAS
ncbi:MAG: ArsA family ATPase [Cyanobacteria bacterium P01_A01_bin.135]